MLLYYLCLVLAGKSLCSAEALMVVPSGANSRPLCPSKLCGHVPKYEFRVEGGIFKMNQVPLRVIKLGKQT